MGMFDPKPSPTEQRLLDSIEAQAATIASLRQEVAELRGDLSGSREALALSDEVVSLRQQVVNLEIDKSKKTEEFEREKRETLHFVGLEKKRQEFEIEQARRETTVAVREENLSAEQKRFEEQMKFHKDQIANEVQRLERVLNGLFERLPTIEFTGDPGPARSKATVAADED